MQYDPHRVYQDALNITHYFFDLELTTIEAVKLRYYVRDVLDPLSLLDSVAFRSWLFSPNYFNPAEETVSRFFSREYGIVPHTDMDDMLHGIVNEDFNAYLKIRQEQFHFP